MKQAVLFDMDGVLVDSEPAHFVVTVDALRANDLPIPDDRDWDRVFLGRPDRDGFTEWFLEHHVSVDIETVMADKLSRFEARFSELVEPFHDGQWLARTLHEHGVRMALVTGARRAEADLVLRTFSLAHVFEARISADDVTSGKPDPQPYLLGAAALSLPTSACIVIEDSVVGLRAAEAAGAVPIVVDRVDHPDRFGTVAPFTKLDDCVLTQILAHLGK